MSERAISVKDHLLDQLPCECALGTRWDVETHLWFYDILKGQTFYQTTNPLHREFHL